MTKLADVLLTFEFKDMNRVLLLISVVWLGSGCESSSDCCGQPSTPRIATSLGIIGSVEDVETTTQTGFLLMGGSTDVDAAFQWMIEASGGGDFVILRASGSTSYHEYIFGLGRINSVETLLIDSRSKAELKETGDRIRQAEAVFIAGGETALCILANGDLRVFGVNYVHFLQSAGSPEVCEPGQKLSWSNQQQAIQVNSIRGSVSGTPAFNMASWPTTADGYWSVVNGVLNK